MGTLSKTIQSAQNKKIPDALVIGLKGYLLQ